MAKVDYPGPELWRDEGNDVGEKKWKCCYGSSLLAMVVAPKYIQVVQYELGFLLLLEERTTVSE